MLSQRTEQWKDIEKISQKMRNLAVSVQSPSAALSLDEAIEGEWAEEIWQQINELNIKRKLSLDVFFNAPVSANESSFLRKHIKSILSLDEELIQTIKIIKRHLGCKFSQLDNQQRAAIAYQTIQASLK